MPEGSRVICFVWNSLLITLCKWDERFSCWCLWRLLSCGILIVRFLFLSPPYCAPSIRPLCFSYCIYFLLVTPALFLPITLPFTCDLLQSQIFFLFSLFSFNPPSPNIHITVLQLWCTLLPWRWRWQVLLKHTGNPLLDYIASHARKQSNTYHS
jgi:hypothetical protein